MGERKYSEVYDYFLVDEATPHDSSIYADGILITPCDIGQGVRSNDRVGNQIIVSSFQAKLVISPWNDHTGQDETCQNATQPDFMLRIIVFTWFGEIQPTLGDIIETDEHFGSPYWNVLSPLNGYKKCKRKVWYDETSTHYATGEINDFNGVATAVYNPLCVRDIYIPIDKYNKVYYTGPSFDPVDDGGITNGLYMFLISNILPFGANGQRRPWPVYIYYRLNYKDF